MSCNGCTEGYSNSTLVLFNQYRDLLTSKQENYYCCSVTFTVTEKFFYSHCDTKLTFLNSNGHVKGLQIFAIRLSYFNFWLEFLIKTQQKFDCFEFEIKW